MKKLTIFLLIIIIIGMTLYYFNKDDSMPVTKDDKITLVFDYNISGKIYKIRREMLALLTTMNIPNIADPNTLLDEQLTDNSIIFYLPQGSLMYTQKDLLEVFFKEAITSYSKFNFNTEQIYKIKFNTEMQPLPFEENQIPLIIKNKQLLSKYQQDVAANNKHYELSFKIAEPYLQPINQWQKNCLVEFKSIDKAIPYNELNLSNYLTSDIDSLAFARYKQALTAWNIQIIQGDTIKNIMAKDSSLKFILLPSKENAQAASLYLYYGKISGNQPCHWPIGLPMQKTIYQETPFAFLVGYQLSILY